MNRSNPFASVLIARLLALAPFVTAAQEKPPPAEDEICDADDPDCVTPINIVGFTLTIAGRQCAQS